MSKSTRERKHPKYYAIEGYMKLKQADYSALGEVIGCSGRTVFEKVNGYSDFTVVEGYSLSRYFGVSLDELFAT